MWVGRGVLDRYCSKIQGLNAVAAPTESTVSRSRRNTSLARYAPAVRALGSCVGRALFVPLIMAFLIWELRDGFDIVSLRGAICRSGFFLLPAVFLTEFLRVSFRKNGLVEKFFDWSPALIAAMQKLFTVVLWGTLPLQFLYLAMQTFQEGKWSDSLGRLLFVGSMLTLSLGLWRAVLELRRWSAVCRENAPRVFHRACFFGVVLATASPLVIACMSLAGYHFGAEQMGYRLVATVLLTITTALCTGFASRILLVTQFKIKLRRLSEEYKNQEVDAESIDISAISSQVNRLLSVTALVMLVVVGWKIWGEVFPANSYLDQVQFWQGPLSKAGEVTWITLRSLLTAVGVLTLTFVLSRNLPGLLEITLLDRLPLDRGGRYAISFVCRYIVGIVGILFACQLMGFSWSSLQWLAAGLTVGLGIGLQEIFANLVSGIIILIERPVRVGDYVTVNGTSGTVIRMQLRATTIQDLDHRELIVPNKKFITEDVMNWTLTEAHSRAIFSVGVAYGSDTQRVQDELLNVAAQHPQILSDPEPVVVFTAFGSSTLDFELRAHVPNRDVYPQVLHEVNMAIDKAFREAEIEIAFPQQDLHIRTGELRIQPDSAMSRLSGNSQAGPIQAADGNQVPPTDVLPRSKSA